ncbi:hypothetical protein DB346_05195 [Verrucomicrobia bacterium LW23]|nr:hypothetical protein DB346_05195 [Verrucomicrobia bacterium LW23]
MAAIALLLLTSCAPLRQPDAGLAATRGLGFAGLTPADRAVADTAYHSLGRGRGGSAPSPTILAEYNAATHKLAAALDGTAPQTARTRLAAAGIDLRIPPVASHIPHEARTIQPRKLYLAKATPGSFTPGAGIPVIIEYATSQADLYPREGLFQGATAIYRPGRPARAGSRAVLDLVPNTAATVTLNGATLPLARDVSADGLMLIKRAAHLKRLGFGGMLNPEIKTHRQQIYMLDPYDPHKIPLLMVHGLQSTPVDFGLLVNSIRQDPVLRARYQVWQFYYTSGTPVLANALRLRESLNALLHNIDPDSSDPATRRIVVLGHSMGGVISHTLVSASGNRLWASIFRVPPEQLAGDRGDIAQLHRIMTFPRNRRVVRAIFVSAPHRGSPVADSPAGIIGNLLVRLPRTLRVGFTQIANDNPDKMTPEALRFYRDGHFSSIRTLSPKSTALRALAEIPPEVPFHTIAGQRHAGPRELGTDGVVPYKSSHLAGAESELVVRGGHNTFRYPAAVEEIKRILRKEAGTPR